MKPSTLRACSEGIFLGHAPRGKVRALILECSPLVDYQPQSLVLLLDGLSY